MNTATTSLTSCRGKDYLEMAKPKVAVVNGVMAVTAFYLAGPTSYANLLPLALGSLALIAGAAAFNMYWERESDQKMARTQDRPIPSGRISPAEGLALALVWSILGMVILGAACRLETALLGGIGWILYALVYTPLKSRTAWAFLPGNLSGAILAIMGGYEGAGEITTSAVILGTALVWWQIPHVVSLSILFDNDYRRGGLTTLTREISPRGARRLAYLGLIGLAVTTAVPVITGDLGRLYGLAMSLVYLGVAYKLVSIRHNHQLEWARTLFRTTLISLALWLSLWVGAYTFIQMYMSI